MALQLHKLEDTMTKASKSTAALLVVAIVTSGAFWYVTRPANPEAVAESTKMSECHRELVTQQLKKGYPLTRSDLWDVTSACRVLSDAEARRQLNAEKVAQQRDALGY